MTAPNVTQKLFVMAVRWWMQNWNAIIAICAILSSCSAPTAETLPERKILAREKSPFALITVSEADGRRYISIGDQEQSAVDLSDKRQWVYKYTYLLSLALLAHPFDKDRALTCLVIGLGGGSFADFLADTFPRWQIRVVEIDPAIIRLARRYFPINKRIAIVQADGREYLQKTREKYDIIVMDAFGEKFIPPALYTLEFFTLMKNRLAPKGMVLMNAWENAALDARELATLSRAFEKGFYLHHPQERPGNRIYLMGTEMDAAEVVKMRITGNFLKYQFLGESPQAILREMQNLHSARPAAMPITDANVNSVLKAVQQY